MDKNTPRQIFGKAGVLPGDNDDENAQAVSSDALEFGKSDSYVCSGATMRCSLGDRSARLTVYPDRTVFLTGQPMASISDHTSLYNIAPFGKCHTTRYPATGAATAAAHGRLTPMPCVPGTKSNWRNGKDDYIIKGNPALLKSSYCKCCYGGIIRIVKDGQVDTGSADLSKLSKKTAEEWTAKEQTLTANPQASETTNAPSGHPFLSVTAKQVTEKTPDDTPRFGSLTIEGRMPVANNRLPVVDSDLLDSKPVKTSDKYINDSIKDIFKYKGRQPKPNDSAENFDLSY